MELIDIMDKSGFCRNYLNLLEAKFKGLNLTRIESIKEFEVKQYEDSVFPFQSFEKVESLLNKSKQIIDIGFGGGFPLLPLASLNPKKKFYGIDARKKKVVAVKEIADEMGIKNVGAIHGRMEDFLITSKSLVTVKAVGSIGKVCNLLNVEKDVCIVFYKGPKFFEIEAKEFETIQANWSIITQERYKLSNGDERTLVVVESKNVPRGTNLKKL